MNSSTIGAYQRDGRCEAPRGASWQQRWAAAAFGLGCLAAAPAFGAVQGITGVATPSCVSAASAAPIPGVRFNLEAREGRVSTADGGSVYAWGFAEAGKAMQYPGPTLIVNQGDCVVVAVTNQLPVYTSVIFPGQVGVNVGAVAGANGGVQAGGAHASKMTLEVRPPAWNATTQQPVYSTATYSFMASEPGTYQYVSGTHPDVQPEMGLQGVLVVRPLNQPKQAYAHAATAFDRENLYVISEVDPARHESVETQVAAARAAATTTGGLPQNWVPDTTAWGPYAPQYWFVNGRTAPDTMTAAGTDVLPHQPYNALARVHPGDRLLLRMVNAGRDLHPMHHHGNHSITIARDGRMLSSGAGLGPDIAATDFTLRMVPGQTVDAIWTWTGKGLGWDISGSTCDGNAAAISMTNCPFGIFDANGGVIAPGVATTTQQWSDLYKPMPTRMPASLEVSYGEMFSGSPYLGLLGQRPVGAGLGNTNGGYWHMFHSHNEREIVNFGIFPGGMMTMLLIEPSYVVIAD